MEVDESCFLPAHSYTNLIYWGHYSKYKPRDFSNVMRAYYQLGYQMNFNKFSMDQVFHSKWTNIHTNCLLQAPNFIRNPLYHQSLNYNNIKNIRWILIELANFMDHKDGFTIAGIPGSLETSINAALSRTS
jgi:hypothetical protein